jgi:2-polyprenyl-3-methyl-5-hydroxy-6-metoxy-1,4-benzoquinol methylase
MEWDPVTHYQDIAVAERYDRERFSRLTGRIFNALEKRAVRKAFGGSEPRAKVIVDIPCGTGRLAEALLEDGYDIVGIDISPAMLDVAKRKLQRFGNRFRTKVGDVKDVARREPLAYDGALCARVLMHFPLDDQIQFLKSVGALSRGSVVFSQSLSTPYQRLRRSIKRLIGNPPPANFPITESQLALLLRGANLKEVRRVRVASLISEGAYIVAERA